MANWIETKITYNKPQENGVSVKKTTESFLVDALSFTEAEARIIKERVPYISGAFEVQAVKKTKIAEVVFNDNGDKFYLIKWNIVSIDERPTALGKPPVEKKIAVLTLIQACTLEEALGYFNKHMTSSLSEPEIVAVAETPILDIYPYESNCAPNAEIEADRQEKEKWQN